MHLLQVQQILGLQKAIFTSFNHFYKINILLVINIPPFMEIIQRCYEASQKLIKCYTFGSQFGEQLDLQKTKCYPEKYYLEHCRKSPEEMKILHQKEEEYRLEVPLSRPMPWKYTDEYLIYRDKMKRFEK